MLVRGQYKLTKGSKLLTDNSLANETMANKIIYEISNYLASLQGLVNIEVDENDPSFDLVRLKLYVFSVEKIEEINKLLDYLDTNLLLFEGQFEHYAKTVQILRNIKNLINSLN